MAGIEEALADVARRTREYGSTLATEEATKNAIVMPFISQVLGYDVFNPAEVVPEFIADVGLKKGEKIDYAIMRDGRVNILVEVKKVGAELSLDHASQLVRYFHVSEARIGVLTNGRTWHFFTDLDRPNVMDERPFLVLDLLDIDPISLPHLRKMSKASFDLDSVIASAEELKYVSAIKREIAKELTEPGEDFVRLFAKRIYRGNLHARALEQFTDLTGKAAKQYVNDRVNARLKVALADQAPAIGVAPEDDAPAAPTSVAEQMQQPAAEPEGKGNVITTEDELEGFRIVRAIVAGLVPAKRVTMRDAQSYCAIILDDNNRKPIARLFFDGKVKRIGVFDTDKNVTRVDIDELEDIYQHADALRETVKQYVEG